MRKPTLHKSVVWFTIFIVTIAAGSLAFNIWLDGGIRNFILNNTPQPSPATLEPLRKLEAQNLHSAHEAIKNGSNDLIFFDKSTHDFCRKGANGIKSNDGFAHRCTYKITYFYGFNGDFKEKMLDFENQLYNDGWLNHAYCTHCSIATIISNYYDVYYGPDKPKAFNFPDAYLVSDLPTPIYKKGALMLELDYAEKSTSELLPLEFSQRVSDAHLGGFYEDKRFVDINALFNHITTQNNYVLAVSITRHYFIK